MLWGRVGQGQRCFQLCVGILQVVYEVVKSLSEVFALDRFAGVLDHLSRVFEYKTEDIPVNLLLDGVKIEGSLFAERFKAVWII